MDKVEEREKYNMHSIKYSEKAMYAGYLPLGLLISHQQEATPRQCGVKSQVTQIDWTASLA